MPAIDAQALFRHDFSTSHWYDFSGWLPLLKHVSNLWKMVSAPGSQSLCIEQIGLFMLLTQHFQHTVIVFARFYKIRRLKQNADFMTIIVIPVNLVELSSSYL
jgi:hypothetical protein